MKNLLTHLKKSLHKDSLTAIEPDSKKVPSYRKLLARVIYPLVQPYFQELIAQAKDKAYKGGVMDTEAKYVHFATNLFHVNPDCVYSVDKFNRPMLNGSVITENMATELKAEAIALENMQLYKVLTETVRQKAIDMGFLNSKNYEEVLSGKLMVHNLGIIRSIVSSMKAYEKK